MKTQHKFPARLAVGAIVVTLALAACVPAAAPVAAAQAGSASPQSADVSAVLSSPVIDITAADDQGNTSREQAALQANLPAAGELSDDEISGLLFMREEEKLAHDVYVALTDQWGLRIFQNIANSEQTHMDAVKTLLDRYGLADPAAATAAGEFVNPDLQRLYDQLIAQGSQSLSEALKVGAAIEEIDILDLEARLAQTTNADIRLVYENLLKGSRNHLRAFTSTLGRQTGETYEPQYLSADAYGQIVGSTSEAGGRGRAGRP